MSFEAKVNATSQELGALDPGAKPGSLSGESWVIDVSQVSKRYDLFEHPKDRLKAFVLPKLHRYLPWIGRASYAKAFWSLRDVSLRLKSGEVLGVIGVNGAGKSSLLQLICGVLEPTSGTCQVKGRVAALLELGAGFNPDFSGRDNIALNATLLGLSPSEIKAKTPSIIEFSGIEDFIDQPVKTYSSGMYVRLAFAIATSVDPDILVIDEALSVGDGAFARKSFDRIMDLKAKGVTILFCSHNIYQVEALCQRALWLHAGEVKQLGPAKAVGQAYNAFLDGLSVQEHESSSGFKGEQRDHFAGIKSMAQVQGEDVAAVVGAVVDEGALVKTASAEGLGVGGNSQQARLTQIEVLADGVSQGPWVLKSQASTLEVKVGFRSGLDLPTPNVAIVITDATGKNITSCSNFYDGVALRRDEKGQGEACVRFERIQLLRGRYALNVFLLCERAIHIYDTARVCEFDVTQEGLELGVVALQRQWVQ